MFWKLASIFRRFILVFGLTSASDKHYRPFTLAACLSKHSNCGYIRGQNLYLGYTKPKINIYGYSAGPDVWQVAGGMLWPAGIMWRSRGAGPAKITQFSQHLGFQTLKCVSKRIPFIIAITRLCLRTDNVWQVSSYFYRNRTVNITGRLQSRRISGKLCSLTHWGRDKMAAISQTTLSTPFLWMKMFEFRLKFHWSWFPRVQLTIFQHWFR